MDVQRVFRLVHSYVADNYPTSEYLIYGSFAAYVSGYIISPNDIDIIITHDSFVVPKSFSVRVLGLEVALEITTMTNEAVFEKASTLEPMFFDITYMYTPSCCKLCSGIEEIINTAHKSSVRSAISSFSSKAYNKGKKKLTVVDDYDQYLGLKNIYHAFKFIHDAVRRLYPLPHTDPEFVKDKDIMEMYDIKRLIFDTYYKSTGTLEERWKTLDAVTKPLYNKYMTQFRKLFPKEIG